MVFFDLRNGKRYLGKLVREAGDGGRTLLRLRQFRGDGRFHPVLPWDVEKLGNLYLVGGRLADIAALDAAAYHIRVHPRAKLRWAEGGCRRRSSKRARDRRRRRGPDA